MEFTILISVQHAFVKALIYTFDNTLMMSAGLWGKRWGGIVRLLAFETTISHNGYLKSERAAGPFSGIKSKRLLTVFFFFLSLLISLLSSLVLSSCLASPGAALSHS